MQTDPNFGNYLINEEGSELTLLDFGSVVQLEGSVRTAICDTIGAGLRHDDAELEAALVRLGCLSKAPASTHGGHSLVLSSPCWSP